MSSFEITIKLRISRCIFNNGITDIFDAMTSNALTDRRIDLQMNCMSLNVKQLA